MTPVGTSVAAGRARRLDGHSLHTNGALPFTQLHPGSSTIFPRAVVKLSVGGVSRFAVALLMSATQRELPAAVVTVNARFLPSRDQSRSRILPDNPDPEMRRVRPVAGSRISIAIAPCETVVYASWSPRFDHSVDPRRPPAGTSSDRGTFPRMLLTIADRIPMFSTR